MMPGVPAQDDDIVGEASLPSPVGSFDFVNGVYDWNGTSLTAAQVTDKTAWIGASGLQVPASQPAGAALVYQAAKDFLATLEFTVAFKIECAAGDTQIIFTAYDEMLADYYEIGWNDEFWADNAGYGMVEDLANGITAGTRRTAISRSNLEHSISVDGHAAVSGNPGYDLPQEGYPISDFFLGGYPTNTIAAINIHWMKIYNLVSASTLNLLSI